MKLINYILLVALAIQPLMHADDSLWSSMSGWVSRNASTIGISLGVGTAFTALNVYLIKKNNAAVQNMIEQQKKAQQQTVCNHACFTEQQFKKQVKHEVTQLMGPWHKEINRWQNSMNSRVTDLFKWQNLFQRDINRQVAHISAAQQNTTMAKLFKSPQIQPVNNNFISQQSDLSSSSPQ